eukprot:TRINITY_DN13075_c0_g1_i1.p2 TRINITY_DN13075_c0_g1~~TRINITY_DN13075_c0_g1_i1.p2  ORF type:complete len:110 (-),score=55.48 TRINITY_DN13075_c0_g1_i1:9-317(-)
MCIRDRNTTEQIDVKLEIVAKFWCGKVIEKITPKVLIKSWFLADQKFTTSEARAAALACKEEAVKISNQPNQIKLITCIKTCLLYTSPSPRDLSTSRMPSSA